MTIRKVGKRRWRLYSRKGRNLGTFGSLKAARHHEHLVKWFKKNKRRLR